MAKFIIYQIFEMENFFMKNEIQLLLHLMAFLVYLLFKIYFPLDERGIQLHIL